MTEYAFTVRGEPRTWPRGIPRIMGTGPKCPKCGKFARMFARVVTPDTIKPWKRSVAAAATPVFRQLVTGCVELEVIVYLPRPQALCRAKDYEGPIRCDKDVGDADNFGKVVMDTLHNIAYENDCIVTDFISRKRYHAKGAAPGARVVVREVDRVPVMFGETA